MFFGVLFLIFPSAWCASSFFSVPHISHIRFLNFRALKWWVSLAFGFMRELPQDCEQVWRVLYRVESSNTPLNLLRLNCLPQTGQVLSGNFLEGRGILRVYPITHSLSILVQFGGNPIKYSTKAGCNFKPVLSPSFVRKSCPPVPCLPTPFASFCFGVGSIRIW